MARTSPAQRAKWNRQLRRVSARSEGKARAAIVREFARAAANFDAGKHERALESIITGAYNETANASYPTAQAMLKGKQARKTVDEARVSWLIGVRQWVERFAKERSRQIARESQRIVTKAVADAAEAGEGQEGGVKRILERLSGSIGRSRARTIARTEIGAAQNMAVSQAAQASGIEYELTWCAAEDERTRASHRAADGQTVKEGESFKVGDAFLDRPGDPSGPGAEVINCRCTVLIEPVLPDDEIESTEIQPAAPVRPAPAKPKLVPKVKAKNPSSIVSAIDDIKSRDYVLENGRKTGVEHINGYDTATGKVFAPNKGERSSVSFTDEMIEALRDSNAQVVMHHNHPRSSSFSKADINMLNYQGAKEIWAHGHDGSAYQATKIRPAVPLDIIDRISLRVELRLGRFVDTRTISPEDASFLMHHSIWSILDSEGWLKYTADLRGRGLEALNRNKELFEQLIKDIR